MKCIVLIKTTMEIDDELFGEENYNVAAAIFDGSLKMTDMEMKIIDEDGTVINLITDDASEYIDGYKEELDKFYEKEA